MNTAAYLLETGDGDAVAWRDGGASYTYSDLRSATREMTNRLGDLGLAKGTPVSLIAPNGVFWIASYLATMAMGLVSVPIPTTVTDDELAARVAWVGSGACLLGRAQAAASARLPEGLPIIDEDHFLDGWGRAPADTVPSVAVAASDDAAYLFTSGTTGAPRVVRITHGNLQANTESILAYLQLRPDDRMLVILPFTYVFGASLLHTHLRAGASLVNQPSIVFADAVVQKLASERCTGFAGVPSAFNLLLRNSSFQTRDLPDLRMVQQAGGGLSPAVLRELVTSQPQARVFVMYGQTEATARLSYLPPDELLERPGSIGRGIPGVDLRVVDENGAPVRPGEVGEIRATGRNISPGYLNDPAATAAKMPGGVLHTGDLATVDADGYIYVVDRVEDFIKSWGYRVASTDVETAAMEMPDLVAAAAVGVPDAAAGERVELVVVTRSGSTATERDVLAHCRARLSKNMVPERVHIVDRLPLNSNGKVVKREIRQMCIASAEAEAEDAR